MTTVDNIHPPFATIHPVPMSNAESESVFVPNLEPKRMTISARQTGPLRQSGLKEIKEKVKEKQMSDPTLYGFRRDYQYIGCWGAESSVKGVQVGLGRKLSYVLPAEEPMVSKLSQCLVSNDTNSEFTDEPDKALTLPQLDFTKYIFPSRTADKDLWPNPNPKAISSRKTLAEMMMTRHVCSLLAKDGIIPLIVSPNQLDRTQNNRTPFGPMLDSKFQPFWYGQKFMAATIYNKYRLKKGKGFNDAWMSNLWGANSCIFRLPEKNGLPVDVAIASGMSPLGEIMRIVGDLPRLGFYFYGSGGTPVVNGFVSPSANSKAATDSSGGREGATFETAQSIANSLNYTMDLLCERGTPMSHFVAGKALPLEYHDPELKSGEQAFYLGPYRVEQCAQEEPLEREDINAMCSFYKAYYDLDSSMLRFHLAYRKKYRAVPIDYQPQPQGYCLLEVDRRDDRKPLFEVPESSSYQALLSTEAPIFISKKEMITEWIMDGGHLEIVDSPYWSITSREIAATKTSHLNLLIPALGTRSAVQTLKEASNFRRPFSKRMAHQAKRKIDFKQHWSILLKCSVASFARQLEINVDASGNIGPLIDSCFTRHTGGGELINYSKYFGIDSPLKFLEEVGPELQKSPTTHPIRTYDPKVLWLMECNGEGRKRSTRNGLSWMRHNESDCANLFFNCIIVEVVKVQVLLEWSRCFHHGLPGHLPLLSDIPEFLNSSSI